MRDGDDTVTPEELTSHDPAHHSAEVAPRRSQQREGEVLHRLDQRVGTPIRQPRGACHRVASSVAVESHAVI